jgi:hypothetical protein
MRHAATVLLAALLAALSARAAHAQQVPDTVYRPAVGAPTYAPGQGPRLCIDEAHFNFHTMGGRFAPFAMLARRDGYRVEASTAAFTVSTLAECDVLVIANAQWGGVPWTQYPYPTPSAFTPAEITAVRTWVEQGGRLLLIADHMPLAGAAAALAAAFGAEFTDGFAYQALPADAATPWTTAAMRTAAAESPTLFRRSDGTLAPHAIVAGREANERITQVRSFTGQAFRFAPTVEGVEPVLVLPDDYVSLEPRVAWVFDSATAIRPVGGWLQGATRRVAAGRVAFFGEAAMFTAQRAGAAQRPMGMNAPRAEQNARFVLNVLRWLVAD